MTQKEFKRFRLENIRTYAITIVVFFLGTFMALKLEGKLRLMFIGMTAVVLLYGVMTIKMMRKRIQKLNIEGYHDALERYNSFIEMKKEDLEKEKIKNMLDYVRLLHESIFYYRIIPDSYGLKGEIKYDLPEHDIMNVNRQIKSLFGITKSIKYALNNSNKLEGVTLYTEDDNKIEILPDKITFNDEDYSNFTEKLKSIKVLKDD